LFGLNANDVEILTSYGVRTNIDLRTSSEQKEYRSALTDAPGVKYINSPLFDSEELNNYSMNNFFELGLGKIYAKNLDGCKKNIKKVFELFGTEIANGAVLYNCTAGKDRTGIITALLLDLAGVCERDIIANYEVTHTLIIKQIELVKKIEPDLPPEVYESSPEHMEYFLGYLYNEYGGAEKYLHDAGVSGDILLRIIQHFCG